MYWRRKFLKWRIPALLFLLAIFVIWSQVGLRVLLRDTLYLTRPIWGTPAHRPEIMIPHFNPKGPKSEQDCRLHHLSPRQSSEIPAVFDAVIFSMETDMLEIRLRELWTVVDRFLVVEADRAFTGKSKPLVLTREWDRFKWAEAKLIYHSFSGLVGTLPDGETPFYNEILLRRYMGSLIGNLTEIREGDLVIESDVDEIPSAQTISLLKSCQGYPDGLHLELRNCLYSFEFCTDEGNWKPHVAIFQRSAVVYYHHQQCSNYILANAGWHCSFCFRNLSQFVLKMLSYAHADRVTSEKQLWKTNIQKKICNGQDLFDMFPEAYSFRELISKLGGIPKTETMLNIPEYVFRNQERFRFLLPGGCIREDYSGRD